MTKKILILALALLAGGAARGQATAPDSLAVSPKAEETAFRPTQLIAPGVLITAGALGASVPGLKSLNRDVRDKMAEWRGDRYLRFDDYLQYLPVVSHFGLSLCGAKAKHGYVERVMTTATAYAAMAVMVRGTKVLVKERRPDSGAKNSFPSGHTATAFMGAELVRMEYKDDSPLYGIGAYTVACGIAFLRVYNERHWCNDVLAGAGIGILSARIAHWLLPLERRLFRLDQPDKEQRRREMSVYPYYDPVQGGAGGTFALRF